MSAALSFRTIFALIPSIVLAVLVLKSIGVLDDGKRSLRQFRPVLNAILRLSAVATAERSQ